MFQTLRDADAWYESAAKTIFRTPPKGLFTIARIVGIISKRAKMFPRIFSYIERVGHQGFFRNGTADREFCKRIFNAWNEEVQKDLPEEKLLVFDVKQGWEPLCRFLEVPVPDHPFPHANKGESFQRDTARKVFNDE